MRKYTKYLFKSMVLVILTLLFTKFFMWIAHAITSALGDIFNYHLSTKLMNDLISIICMITGLIIAAGLLYPDKKYDLERDMERNP